MSELASLLTVGLLGIGTGIFIVLSLLEKPVWGLMRNIEATHVEDRQARAVHDILKRVIPFLPPTMLTTMTSVTVLMIFEIVRTEFSIESLALASLFLVQLALIVVRLRKDIRGVNEIDSDNWDIGQVRSGVGALAFLHHRGLLMTTSTLIALIIYQLHFSATV